MKGRIVAFQDEQRRRGDIRRQKRIKNLSSKKYKIETQAEKERSEKERKKEWERERKKGRKIREIKKTCRTSATRNRGNETVYFLPPIAIFQPRIEKIDLLHPRDRVGDCLSIFDALDTVNSTEQKN